MKKIIKYLKPLLISVFVFLLILISAPAYIFSDIPPNWPDYCYSEIDVESYDDSWTWGTPCDTNIVAVKIVAEETGGAVLTWFINVDYIGYSIAGVGTDTVSVTEKDFNILTIGYYYNCCPKQKKEPEPVWVRTMPMTCWQVWINEDNNFQFIFWYPYKDNNWVRIYDMEGNMVFEVGLPVDNLIVDLPDGFYMVKTFHHNTLLQEFLIGKP